jgi:hypothetical protein
MSDSEDEHLRFDEEEEQELMEDFAHDWALWFHTLTEKEKNDAWAEYVAVAQRRRRRIRVAAWIRAIARQQQRDRDRAEQERQEAERHRAVEALRQRALRRANGNTVAPQRRQRDAE